MLGEPSLCPQAPRGPTAPSSVSPCGGRPSAAGPAQAALDPQHGRPMFDKWLFAMIGKFANH